MMKVDNQQFNDVNEMLFQDGRWFLFLDSFGYDDMEPTTAATAHRCKPLQKEGYIPGERVKSGFTTCLVVRNGACQDCNDPVPDSILTLQVLYNGEYIENHRTSAEGGYFG